MADQDIHRKGLPAPSQDGRRRAHRASRKNAPGTNGLSSGKPSRVGDLSKRLSDEEAPVFHRWTVNPSKLGMELDPSCRANEACRPDRVSAARSNPEIEKCLSPDGGSGTTPGGSGRCRAP